MNSPAGMAVGVDAARVHDALNATAADYPAEDSVPTVFARHAGQRPDATAVVCGDRRLSYRELAEASDRLAARLAASGVRPGQFVGVLVARSPELVVGLLAVLKCGAAYVPFDGAWPDQRILDLFEQTGCGVVLTDRAEATAARFPAVATVAVASEASEACEDGTWPGLAVPADASAYVNLTSGSHGRPKGVLVPHRAVLRLVSGATYTRLDEDARVLHLAPITFDAATFEIWGPLLNGGTCVVYPSPLPRLSELRRVVVDHRVTTVFLTTALFNSVVDEAPATLDTVRSVLTGGEAHSLRAMDLALGRYGPGRVTHVYGPTECTTFATHHHVHSLPPDGRPVPIGRPIQNTRAYVVADDRLCGPGEVGELLLAGPGLSAGYVGMPEATAARFIEIEVGGVRERVYRTGDLVRTDGDGDVVFVGRMDDQVKINGFRVEPSEVAHHLERHPGVRQSVVCAVDGALGQRVLVAFVVVNSGVDGNACTPEALRAHLAGVLPAYLVPGEIHLCESLPLSETNKVDRRALVALHAAGRQPQTPLVPVSDVLATDHPVRARFRAALAEVVLPNADEWEESRRIPAAGWRALADAGMLGMPLSGSGFTDSAILLEELGRTGYAGIRAGVAVHAFMAAHYLDRFGTPEQRAELLADVRAGRRVAALALSEPDAGTDLAAITTKADPDGAGGYRLTGRKAHVANGSQAGFYVCLTRLRTIAAHPRSLAGCGLLLVDADAPGVRVTPEPMLGWRSADVCEVTFDDVPVPAGRVLGNPARTLSYLVDALDFERLAAGLLAAGGAAHCLALLDTFVREHHVGGRPLSANQVVRHTIADLAAELDLVRSYAHLAALRHACGQLDTTTAATLKLRATELAAAASRVCLQYHGARGYREGSAVARIHRDAAAGTIAAGANELLRDLVFDAAALG